LEALRKWRQDLEEAASKQAVAEEELRERMRSVERREDTATKLERSLDRQREKLNTRQERVTKREAELQEAQAAVEKLQREGVQRITNWAGEASSVLVPFGMSPIPVAESPATIADALPVLDSAAEWLQRLDQALGARLEAEGRELCQMVVEHVLTCFRSHDPDCSLAPVVEGPVAEAEASAWESVQEAVKVIAARFQRDVDE
jgi:exonuclease VII large subunit